MMVRLGGYREYRTAGFAQSTGEQLCSLSVFVLLFLQARQRPAYR